MEHIENFVTLIGRLVEIKENGVVLSIQKKDGCMHVYVETRGSIGENIKEYCKVGSMMAIKGGFDSIDDNLTIVAYKVSYLAPGAQD